MDNTVGWISSIRRRCRAHLKWKCRSCWKDKDFWKDVVWKIFLVLGAVYLYWQFQRFEWEEKRITVKHLKDPILSVNPELQLVRTRSGAVHVEVLVKLENTGVADLEIDTIGITAERGVPKERLREALEALAKPLTPTAGSSEIVKSLGALIVKAGELNQIKAGDRPSEDRIEEAQSAVIKAALEFWKRAQDFSLQQRDESLGRKELLKQFTLVDLGLKSIQWQNLDDMSRVEEVSQLLHKGQKYHYRFRYLMIPHDPECYRFVITVRPDEKARWRQQQADILLPINFLTGDEYIAAPSATYTSTYSTYPGQPFIITLQTGSPHFPESDK